MSLFCEFIFHPFYARTHRVYRVAYPTRIPTMPLELLESVVMPRFLFFKPLALSRTRPRGGVASLKQGIDDPDEHRLIWHSPCTYRHRVLIQHHRMLDSHATAIR